MFETVVGIITIISATVGVLVAIYKPLTENTKQIVSTTMNC